MRTGGTPIFGNPYIIGPFPSSPAHQVYDSAVPLPLDEESDLDLYAAHGPWRFRVVRSHILVDAAKTVSNKEERNTKMYHMVKRNE